MKVKSFLLLIGLTVLFTQCGSNSQTEEQIQLPPGLVIRSQFTTRVSNEQPVDDIIHVPHFFQEFYVYSALEGINTVNLTYQWKVVNNKGEITYQDPPYFWEPNSSVGSIWSRIKLSECMTKPDDYTVKIYLNGALVLVRKIKVLSEEDIGSGKYEAYWNKEKYLPFFAAAKTKLKGEWIVNLIHTEWEERVRLSHLLVVPHKSFNRIFWLKTKTGTDAVLQEYTNFGPIDISAIPEDYVPGATLLPVGDVLYFFGKNFSYAYDLNSGKTESTSPPYAFNNRVFTSPSGKHQFTDLGLLNGKPVAGYSDGCNAIYWPVWGDNEETLYFVGPCRGLYKVNVSTNQAELLMNESDYGMYASGFVNNGNEFIAFVDGDTEGGDNPQIKIATRLKFYEELGFGPNVYWNNKLSFDVQREDKGGEYSTFSVTTPTKEIHQYNYHHPHGELNINGYIRNIGTIQSGPLAGKELYQLVDKTIYEYDKSSITIYQALNELYLVRNGKELIVINLPEDLPDGVWRVADPDRKRAKLPIFEGISKITAYQNFFIQQLWPVPVVTFENTAAVLAFQGNVAITRDQSFRKIFTHPTEGDFYVRQPDDGSFWRFNANNSAALFAYRYDFEVMLQGNKIAMDDYTPSTNFECTGNPQDFAHVLTPDPSRLTEIGSTETGDVIYGFASDQDEILRKEYDDLKEAYTEYGDAYTEPFKSFSEFLASKPMFLWKDPFGRYLRFIKREYLRPANCEPIVYVYGDEASTLSITIDEKVQLLQTIPRYHGGWNVSPNDNGTLKDLSTFKNHESIFWEGISDHLPPLKKGFVVAQHELPGFFDDHLSALGLNAKEIEDFKLAWLKELRESAYYFIGFYEQSVIDRYAPLRFNPQPETIIRVLMDYRPLKAPVPVENPVLRSVPVRTGLTVVEWGGLKRF